jgi:O-acetylhomoserine (thiol)-lyase
MNVPDIPPLAHLAREHNIPLVVDATLIPPSIAQTGRLGADIVIHSTSKFINGHGTAIGGALIDTGNYNWGKGAFPDIRQLARRAGILAFLAHLRTVIYRDLGGCPAPMNSFLMLQGLETLVPRMQIHCSNALRLAGFLAGHPDVAWVNYPALPGSVYRERVEDFFDGNAGGVLAFGLGDKARSIGFINSLTLAKNMTNLGDAKTLVLHPATTIFHEYGPEERERMGVFDDSIRVSVGIEDYEDIQIDFEQAIENAVRGRAGVAAATT